MKKVVGIGNQNFKSIIELKSFYVDKTHFIKEWWESLDIVTLIARPRRFGKTLNISMLDYFFSNRYEKGGQIFEGLSIWADEGFRVLQGTYPVISISFSDMKESNFEAVIEKMQLLVAGLYNNRFFLMEGELLSEAEKMQFDELCKRKANTALLKTSVKLLSEFLYRYYGKKAIILIDEYDTPLQEAYVNGYWDEMVGFIRGLFNATLKSNEALERGLLTGITRVSKESIFSDLNNLAMITTSSEKYADCFGFTTKEVAEALEYYEISEQAEEVKRWYDGFIFGNGTVIYNPWSIINYLSERKFKAYWANTSSNSLVGKLMRQGDKNTKQSLQDLMQGKSIRVKVDEQIVFNQLDYNREAVWSLMTATGYLKILDQDLKSNYTLALTNYEVLLMFENMVSGWFQQSESYNDFIKALLANAVEEMNEYMNRVALSTISFFDAGSQPSEKAEPERFYHGFVLGLMVDLEDRYAITSNRESGFGRYDVMLEPKHPEDAGIIMEFKVFNAKKEQDLEATAQSALKQIDEMKYEEGFRAKGITNIKKYGFCFEGKNVLIVEGKARLNCEH